MTEDEYAGWSEMNDAIHAARVRATWPCVDCTRKFAAEQRGAGCCNGEAGLSHEPAVEPTVAALRAKWREQARRWRAANPQGAAACARRYRERKAAAA
jgi:hypothetical protein